MSPESNSAPQITDYPVNPFEEPHDHANQWDVSMLWPDPQPQARHDEAE